MLKTPLRCLKGGKRKLSTDVQRKNMSNQIGRIAKEAVDCVVIGAGVIGIAIAREISMKKGRDVIVIESASTFGTGTSSRNSQVIHAGIYYPPNSLKAALCVRGRELLYKYCCDHGVPHKQTGKLIVATQSAEIPKLKHLMKCGIENGVEVLRMMEGSEAMQMEPELKCVKALWSPCTGIFDSHSLMVSLLGEAESHGATFSYNTTVFGGHVEDNGIQLYICATKDLENCVKNSSLQPQLILVPKLVINSAGLSAVPLAKRFFSPHHGAIRESCYYARGCYFTLSGTRVPPFRHLIYPLPENGGIGVHVTLDLDGHVKFGPDVEWVDGLDDIPSFLNKSYAEILSRNKKVLSESERWIFGARLCRHSTKDIWSSTASCRLCHTEYMIMPYAAYHFSWPLTSNQQLINHVIQFSMIK